MTTREAYTQLKEKFPNSKILIWDWCGSDNERYCDNPQRFSVEIGDVSASGSMSLEATVEATIAKLPTPEQITEQKKAKAKELQDKAKELTQQAEEILKTL